MASVATLERPVERDAERELIVAAQSGDRSAAEALLVRIELVVHRICRHLLPVDEDPDAVAQEALLRVLRSLPRFSRQGSFAGWAATIAVNLCRDRLRRRRLVPFVPLEVGGEEDEGAGLLAVIAAPAPDPERVAMARQALRRVREVVASLPERQREVFALRFWVGLELGTIAASLGVDVGTVKTHLFRAVHRVREAVAEAVP